LIVDFAGVFIGAGPQVLFAAGFEQLDAVVRADLVSEVVEEFEYREGLLWRPVAGILKLIVSGRRGGGLGCLAIMVWLRGVDALVFRSVRLPL
jgi:hypothetical protein